MTKSTVPPDALSLMTDELAQQVGKALQRARGDRTQEWLSGASGVSRIVISKIENGKQKRLELATYAALSKALGTETDWFVPQPKVVYSVGPEPSINIEEDIMDRRDALRTIGATVATLGTPPFSTSSGGDLRLALIEQGWLHPAEHADAITCDVDLLNRLYQAAQYQAVRSQLPRVIDVFALTDISKGDTQLLKAKCGAHLIAAKVANKIRDQDQALSQARQAHALAGAANDIYSEAASVYQMACAYLNSGEYEQAEDITIKTASTLNSSTPSGLTWRGSLTLLASVSAAKRHDSRL
ncbi:MAG: helix-turn-helix transcriptional regulator, partial [Pseudomonadota bacterium]